MTTTITATAEPAATPPRVRLDVTTNQTSLTLYRVAQDGTRTPVRSYDGGPFLVAGGTMLAFDAEVPQGEPFTYGSSDAATTPSAVASVDSGRVWLQHAGVPSRSMPVRIAKVSDRTAAANLSVRYPLGRRFPIVANDGVRKADTYTLTVRTTGAAELAALKALLADLGTLLLNVPPSKQWIDLGTEYIAVGDLQRANPTGWAQFPYRESTLPCSVTDRPTGGTQAFNTYGTSAALYATYGARYAAAATYGQAFDPK